MTKDWNDDDDFLIDDDDIDSPPEAEKKPWHLLVVDDEEGVHDITKVALQRFSFEDRPIEITSAFSAAEALTILTSRDDIAIILLDVVMETDHAGLDLAHKIREELQNEDVRIVLRTGQPGLAPEEDVILAFDINDYRPKTELTSQRLFSTVISALRNYRDIKTLQTYQKNAYDLLGENSQTIQSLIDKAERPLLQVGNRLGIQRCNQAFADLLGKKAKDIIGISLLEMPDVNIERDEKVITIKIGAVRLQLTALERPDGSITCFTGTTQ